MIFRAIVLYLLLMPIAAFGQSVRSVTIVTEPSARVWIDDVEYGTTDSDGRIRFRTFAVGVHKLRVRAQGFREVVQNLPAGNEIKVPLVQSADEAELAFQMAEAESDKEKAAALYEKAIKIRPNYPDAFIGLARVQSSLGDVDEAMKAVRAARKLKPGFALASTVEARILKDEGNLDQAVASFKRAIIEGRGFQPEAHTGLGLIYREKAESSVSDGDTDSATANYLLAAGELQKAATQLAGAPDAITIYQLLGDSYERADKWPEAIRVYEQFLRVFPDANEAEMFRSFIVQAKKRIASSQ